MRRSKPHARSAVREKPRLGGASSYRGGRIRTGDLPLPKRALHQAELRPGDDRTSAQHGSLRRLDRTSRFRPGSCVGGTHEVPGCSLPASSPIRAGDPSAWTRGERLHHSRRMASPALARDTTRCARCDGSFADAVVRRAFVANTQRHRHADKSCTRLGGAPRTCESARPSSSLRIVHSASPCFQYRQRVGCSTSFEATAPTSPR